MSYEVTKLRNHPYAQAHIETYGSNIALFSYTTLVASFTNGSLFCNGTYSQTTRKHLGWWAREMRDFLGVDLTYHDLKWLFEHHASWDAESGFTIDYVTGEILGDSPLNRFGAISIP